MRLLGHLEGLGASYSLSPHVHPSRHGLDEGTHGRHLEVLYFD